MKFAKIVFRIAAIWGFLILMPLYFLENTITPPLNHPDYYYGFLGVALAFQIVFWIISTHPSRYRSVMLAAMIEKLSYVIALTALYIQHRLPSHMLTFGMIDGVLLLFFIAAYLKTPKEIA